MNRKFVLRTLVAGGVAAAASSISTSAAAAISAACLDDARKIADQNRSMVGTAIFIDGEQHIPIAMTPQKADNTSAGRIYFTLDAGTPLPSPPEMSTETGAWSSPTLGCGGKLRSVRFKPKPATKAVTESGKASQRAAVEAAFASKSRSLKELRKIVADAQQERATQEAAIHAHGAEEIASETVQMLGQLVVDRATAEAYAQIKSKLEDLLHCDDKPMFQATCSVVVPLRVEDVASSRDALLGALAADALALARSKSGASSAEPPSAIQLVMPAIVSIVLPAIARPSIKSLPTQSQAIADVITEQLAQEEPATQSEAVVNFAARALLRCVAETISNPDELGRCNIAQKIDVPKPEKFSEAAPAARVLGTQLLAILTAATSDGKPDARARLAQAVDTLFATACMLDKKETPPVLACDDASRIAAPTKDHEWLAVIRPIFAAGAVQDTNGMVAGSLHVLTLTFRADLSETDKKTLIREHTRAFQLLGAVLDYASTYVETGKNVSTDDAKAAHDRRTKILESLTKSMTVRTGRGGDAIFSLGGALRGVAGGRIGTRIADDSFYGPLSLPIGFGFDYLGSSTSWGFHGELGIIDLGEYVGFDKTAQVRTPDLAQAFAPTLTLGAAYGRSIPFFFGATTGYSPTFVVNPAREDKRGTFNIGFTTGFYVPLFDFN